MSPINHQETNNHRETNRLAFPKSLLQLHLHHKMKSSFKEERHIGEADKVKNIARRVPKTFPLKSPNHDQMRLDATSVNRSFDLNSQRQSNRDSSFIAHRNLNQYPRSTSHRLQYPISQSNLTPMASSTDFFPDRATSEDDLSFLGPITNEISVDYMDLSDDCESVRDDMKQWEFLDLSPVQSERDQSPFHDRRSPSMQREIRGEQLLEFQTSQSVKSPYQYRLSPNPTSKTSSPKFTSRRGNLSLSSPSHSSNSSKSRKLSDDITNLPVHSLKIHSELSRSFENALEKSIHSCFPKRPGASSTPIFHVGEREEDKNHTVLKSFEINQNECKLRNSSDRNAALIPAVHSNGRRRSIKIWDDYKQNLNNILERRSVSRPKPIQVDESLDIEELGQGNEIKRISPSTLIEFANEEEEDIGQLIMDNILSKNRVCDESALIDEILRFNRKEYQQTTSGGNNSDKENVFEIASMNTASPQVKRVLENEISLPSKHCRSPSSRFRKLNHTSLFVSNSS